MGKITYKIILVIVCLTQPKFGFAVDVCTTNDSISVILDPNIVPTSAVPTETDGSRFWAITYSNGSQVKGDSTCLTSNYELDNFEVYRNNNGLLMDNGAVITGGEQNGLYCWCKITFPVVSYWIFRDSHGSQQACTNNCSYYCAKYYIDYDDITRMGNYVNALMYRKALFNAIK